MLHRVDSLIHYVHPKNSNHLWSHSWARMDLDHSRLGLENKFLKNKSGRIFCCQQVYFPKSYQTNLGMCKPTFCTFYSSHLRWNSTFYYTDLRQKLCSILQFFKTNCTKSIFRTYNRGVLEKLFKKFPKSPIRLAGSHFWRAPNLQWTLIELHFNIIKNLLFLFFYLMVL